MENPIPLDAPPFLDQMLSDVPAKISDYVLKRFDAGIFTQELVEQKIAPIETEGSDAPSKDDSG